MNKKSNQNPFENFSKLSRKERFERLLKMGALTPEDIVLLESSVHQDFHNLAEQFVENSLGCFPLPLGIAAHLVINQKEYAVPMAIEETSVIAAVSNMAKWIRQSGEIQAKVVGQNIIGQIQFGKPSNSKIIEKNIITHKKELINLANQHVVPNLVARGGGVTDILYREILRPDNHKMVVLHVLLNPCDAMGANLINQVCEYLKEPLEKLTGEKVTLCILSNLVDTKLTEVNIIIRNIDPVLGNAIQEASVFGECDPYRAATHNKGILNGMDAVAIATGNDWRAVDAGVHAYAARDGQYRAVSKWCVKNNDLIGVLKAPVIVGTVGGVTRLHPMAKLSLRMLGVKNSDELSCIIGAVGLVQNLGALRALCTQGIVEGHMTLHLKNLILGCDANEQERQILLQNSRKFIQTYRKITESDVKTLLDQLREKIDAV